MILEGWGGGGSRFLNFGSQCVAMKIQGGLKILFHIWFIARFG
jgi:hypothetical protein